MESHEKAGDESPKKISHLSDVESVEPDLMDLSVDMDTIALRALHVDDDTTLNPWTFRMFFLGGFSALDQSVDFHGLTLPFTGLGLSAFGSALATIFLFKPQSVSVSIIFLTVISYAAGLGMELVIPKGGFIGKWLNPHPFNSKEHLAIVM